MPEETLDGVTLPGINPDLAEYDNLQLMYGQLRKLIERRLEITTNPKPNYEVDGATYSWSDYLKRLNESVDVVRRQISDFEGPEEVMVTGVPGDY